MKRKYDYEKQTFTAAVVIGRRPSLRRILRKLVRHAVLRAGECGKHEAIDADLAQRIAKELVP